MDCRKRFERALSLKKVDRPPVAVPTNTGIIDLMEASRCFWPEAQRDPEKMAGLSMAAHQVAGVESLSVPFDKFVEAEAMGCTLEGWGLEQQPRAIPIIDGPEDIPKAKLPDPRKDGRMPVVLEAVEALARRTDSLPIIASISSPFEIVSTIWNPNTLVVYLEYKKEPLLAMLEKATAVAINYGKALEEAGATAVALIDGNSQNLFATPMELEYSFYDGAELGAEVYEEFSSQFSKKVVEALRVPTILHLCGDSMPVLDHMAETGAAGLSLDRVDVAETKRRIKGAAIIGNVSIESLWKASPEGVAKEAREALEKGVDILAPGCNFMPRTPLGNIKAMVRAAQEFRS